MNSYNKILILVIVIIFLFTSLAMAYNLKEYYPLAEGDSWTYSVIKDKRGAEEKTDKVAGIEVVGNVETKKMISGEDKYACIALDSEGVKLYKANDDDKYTIFNPPKIIFPNIENIEIGETRGYSVRAMNYEGSSIKDERSESVQISLEFTMDDVDVPAGKFSNCLRFSTITKWNEQLSGDNETENCDVWLAPEVGKVKESCVKSKYKAKTNETLSSTVEYGLISAIVGGKELGSR